MGQLGQKPGGPTLEVPIGRRGLGQRRRRENVAPVAQQPLIGKPLQ